MSGLISRKVEGLPANLGFGKQIFGCKKGQSIVPHGHANMCTGFIVLKGKWHGKHYDRIESHTDHYVIKPTIDRHFEPGELSTISDHKDNVHWFKCGVRRGVHLQRPRHRLRSEDQGEQRAALSRFDGEKLAGGLIKAPKMSSADVSPEVRMSEEPMNAFALFADAGVPARS